MIPMSKKDKKDYLKKILVAILIVSPYAVICSEKSNLIITFSDGKKRTVTSKHLDELKKVSTFFYNLDGSGNHLCLPFNSAYFDYLELKTNPVKLAEVADFLGMPEQMEFDLQEIAAQARHNLYELSKEIMEQTETKPDALYTRLFGQNVHIHKLLARKILAKSAVQKILTGIQFPTVNSFKVADSCGSLSWAPSGIKIAAHTNEDFLIIDTETNEIRKVRLSKSRDERRYDIKLAWSPDEKHIAIARPFEVIIWDVEKHVQKCTAPIDVRGMIKPDWRSNTVVIWQEKIRHDDNTWSKQFKSYNLENRTITNEERSTLNEFKKNRYSCDTSLKVISRHFLNEVEIVPISPCLHPAVSWRFNQSEDAYAWHPNKLLFAANYVYPARNDCETKVTILDMSEYKNVLTAIDNLTLKQVLIIQAVHYLNARDKDNAMQHFTSVKNKTIAEFLNKTFIINEQEDSQNYLDDSEPE